MKRAVLTGMFMAVVIVHVIVAWWTPIQGDDWGHWMWAAHHAGSSALRWTLQWLGAHHTFGDAAAYAVTRCEACHVIISPLVACALIVGLFVLAMRRLPRATWDDILALGLVSALFWLAQPRAGLVWFHRSFVATEMYSLALAAWWLAPLRCGWTVPRRLVPVMLVGAALVGTTPRPIALALLVTGCLAYRRGTRPSWLKPALVVLAIATAVTLALPPWLEVGRVFKRGLEPNLVLVGFALKPAGAIVALVLALALVERLLGGSGARGDAADTLRWFGASLGLTAFALFGPHYSEAALAPATAAIVIAALPWLMRLAERRALRIVLAATAIVTHATAWAMALSAYHQLGGEWQARRELLEHAPRGSVATMPPYSQILPTFWVFGEDFGGASSREEIAAEVFELRHINLEPEFRRYEPSSGIAVRLDVDGISPDDVAKVAPAVWAGEPSSARDQFDAFVDRLRNQTGSDVDARLVATSVPFAQAGKRPLLVAWTEHGKAAQLRTSRSPADANDRYQIAIYAPFDAAFDEAWVISGGVAKRADYRDGHPRLQPLIAQQEIVIACNRERCVVVDAFVPRF